MSSSDGAAVSMTSHSHRLADRVASDSNMNKLISTIVLGARVDECKLAKAMTTCRFQEEDYKD
eukprot:1850847-Amphidinium_carterae.1